VDLQRLVMIGQHFGDPGEDEETGEPVGAPVFPDGMTQLHTLWIKRCELRGLSVTTGLLRGLR